MTLLLLTLACSSHEPSAVVQIRQRGVTGVEGLATGFHIGDGLVLTAAHALRNEALLPGGMEVHNGRTWVVAGALAEDSSADVAVLCVPGLDVPTLSLGGPGWASDDEEWSVLGLDTAGAPFQLLGSWRIWGNVGGGEGYVVEAAVEPGWSGSPVVDAGGRVVGVIVTGTLDPRLAGVGPVERFEALLDRRAVREGPCGP